jgi:hypothetical protein
MVRRTSPPPSSFATCRVGECQTQSRASNSIFAAIAALRATSLEMSGGQRNRFRHNHSLEPAAAAGGAACVGGDGGVRRFGAAGFFAAAGAAGATDDVGRGDSNDALAADDGEAADAGGAARCSAGAEPGSGVMMLTAGVEAAVGKSALVGRPGGIEDSIATGADAEGAFHNAEYFVTIAS